MKTVKTTGSNCPQRVIDAKGNPVDCELCGAPMELEDKHDEPNTYWISCPEYMTGELPNADEHDAYLVRRGI